MIKYLKKPLDMFFLFLIFFFGLYLYTYKLDKIPNGFYTDEALPGYNAYSLLQTGKDEYGKWLPIALRFYGSYNPPLYTLSVIPSIKLLGLNVFAVRLPAAIFGVFSAFVVFYFLKNLDYLKFKISPYLGALLFLITPWHFFYSRIGYEVGLAFLLFSGGVLFCYLSLKNKYFLLLGLFILSLSTYTAYTQRFLVPIFIVFFFIIFRKILFCKNYRHLIYVGIFLLIITQILNLTILPTPAFFPKSDLFSSSESAGQIHLIREFLSKYFGYFSLRSLFFLPDPDLQRSIPELSVFYSWMLIPFIIGLLKVIAKKSENSSKIILLLFLVSPIPAALTKDPFSTHRALPLLLPFFLIIITGIDQILKKRVSLTLLAGFTVFSISLIILWRSYFVLLPNERADVWGYGFEQLANEIISRPKEHFLIDQTRIKPAYISLAFFLKYPPEKFQQTVDPTIQKNYYTDSKFDNHYKFANLETKNVAWEEDIYEEQIIVGDIFTVSQQQAEEHILSQVFEIKDPLGKIVFIGYKTNPLEKCKKVNFKSSQCKS